MGERKHTKGKVGRRQRRQAPRRVRDSPPAPVPPGFSPPGTCSVRSVSAAGGLMPGCRGRSPRRNNLWGSPFPAGEGGWGDGGQQSKLKAGLGGRQSRQAPRRVQQPRAATTGEFFRPEQVPAEVPSMIHSGKVLRGSGDSFKSPPAFFLLHCKKKLAISGRMCYNKHTSGAAGTGGASSRKAEGKEEPS